MELPQIKISEKKTQAILEESGMLDAYKYLLFNYAKMVSQQEIYLNIQHML